MAESVKDVSDQLEQLQQQLEQVGVFSQNTTKTMGLFERQQLKITTALKKSPIYGLAQTLKGYAQSVSKVTAITGKNSTMTAEEKEKLREKMTVMEKLTAATIGFGVAQKISNKLLAVSNNGFTRLLVSAFSLVSIFMIVGFALAALSIAFDGANSPILKMTEDLGPLHDAAQGLVLVLTGEGDEGGLSSALDVLAISLLAAGVASLVLGGTVGIIVGAFTLAVGVARIFYNEFENLYGSILVGVGVFMTLIGSVLMLKTVFAALKAGTVIAVKGTIGAVVAGIGLVIAGIGGLVAFAMGAGEGIKGVLLGIVSAVLVFVGLLLAGLALVPAAIIAGVALLIATIIRYWDDIKAFLGSALDWLIGAGAFIINGVVSGGAWVITSIVNLITGAIGLIVGAVSYVFNGVINVGKGFLTYIMNALISGVMWVIGLPGRIINGIIGGIKAIINGIIGIYNGFADKMSFKIPKWVPKIGGKKFKLPSIPLLAKGGVVDSPTLAMIGEDGPEAVVPLNRKNNPRGIGLGGSGEMTVNINVGGVTDRTDKRALAKEIGDLIRAEMTRGGRSHGNRRSSV